MRKAFVSLIAFISVVTTAYTQDFVRSDSVFVLEVPEKLILPANIYVYNKSISLLPENYLMFDMMDYPGYNYQSKFIPNLWEWQRDFIRRNGLYRLPSGNPTLADGNIMGLLLEGKTHTNQEIYLNTVILNQRMVGNTQLQRMNVRYREIRHFDFIGIGRLGTLYLLSPEKFGTITTPTKTINIRMGPRK